MKIDYEKKYRELRTKYITLLGSETGFLEGINNYIIDKNTRRIVEERIKTLNKEGDKKVYA